MSSFRARFRKFLAGWGRDLALAGGGALSGLVIAFALGVGARAPGPPPSSPAPVASAHAAAAPARRPVERRWRRSRTFLPEKVATAPVRPAGRDALPAWQRFAAAAGDTDRRPVIAIIIDDMGVDRGRSARAIRLPPKVTLSFLPYAAELSRQTDAARRGGHELMVHVPMEPDGGTTDPGPDVLRSDAPPGLILRQLDRALGKFTGFVGLNNHMGSRFTADPAAMRVVLSELARRGLLFVDSRTTAKTVAPELTRALGVPFAQRDVFIDDDPSHGAVVAQLRRLETIARRQGHAIGIGHPRDTTLDALEGWLWGLQRRGFALVPVSAVVRRNGRHG